MLYRVMIAFDNVWGETEQMEVDVEARSSEAAVHYVLENVQVTVVDSDEEAGTDG